MEIAYRMYPLPNGTTYTEADIQTQILMICTDL